MYYGILMFLVFMSFIVFIGFSIGLSITSETKSPTFKHKIATVITSLVFISLLSWLILAFNTISHTLKETHIVSIHQIEDSQIAKHGNNIININKTLGKFAKPNQKFRIRIYENNSCGLKFEEETVYDLN